MFLTGFYSLLYDEVSMAIQNRSKFLVINVYGGPSAGKSTLSREAFTRCSLQYDRVSLPEYASLGWEDFVRKLVDVGHALLTEYESLDSVCKLALTDFIMHTRRCSDVNSVWILISEKPLSFCDKFVKVPAIGTDASTFSSTIESLIGDFAIEPTCPVASVVSQVCLKLSIGELHAMLNYAKLAAFGEDKPLSCHYISRAMNQLNLPCSLLLEGHSCEVFRVSRDSLKAELSTFAGHSALMEQHIHTYVSEREDPMLIISGPTGSGKTHLARLIANSTGRRVQRVTAADILKPRIGESEKSLFTALNGKNCDIILEDIDELFPRDSTHSTGSVQRLLPVLIYSLDLSAGDQKRLVIGTTLDVSRVADRVLESACVVELGNNLSFDTKVTLIRTEFPDFNSDNTVLPFDLILMDNRSKCTQYGRDRKFELLRERVAQLDSRKVS